MYKNQKLYNARWLIHIGEVVKLTLLTYTLHDTQLNWSQQICIDAWKLEVMGWFWYI